MRIYIYIIFLFLSINLSAQEITDINYSGIITLENGSLYPFEMYLKEKNGIINGYSITSKGSKDETKSDISGTYNKKTKSYILKETQVLETNSEAELSSFCYINMEINTKGKFSSKRMEGKFIGYFSDGKQCAQGKVILIEKEKLEKKIDKINKKLNNIQTKQKKEEKPIISTKVLTDGDNMEIDWSSEKINIYIWDPSQEDGDKISLMINNKLILNNYETKRKRKKIKYKLKKGLNIIKIKAENLGKSPPNTSRIELVDSKIKYPIVTQLKLNESAIIRIIR